MPSLNSSLVAGRYRLIAQLGAGGFGRVYHAHDPIENRDVALKILPLPGLEPDKKEIFLSSFKNEFKVLTKLSHPHVCRVFDYGYDEAGGNYFFTTELVEGVTVLKATEGVSLSEIQDIFVQICRALEYIHAHGVVHYDIKPDNILVSRVGGSPQAKVVDFGLARGKLESRKFTAGTVKYMAPEVIVGGKVPDYRSDLYALGIVLYEILARRYPFDHEDQRALIQAHMSRFPKPLKEFKPDIPDWWDDLVSRLVAKSPASRFSRANSIIKFINLEQEKQYELETKATLKSYTFTGNLIARDDLLDRCKDRIDFTLGAMAGSSSEPALPSMVLVGEAGTGKTRCLGEIKYYCQLNQIPVATAANDSEFWSLLGEDEGKGSHPPATDEDVETRRDDDFIAGAISGFLGRLPPSGEVLIADGVGGWDEVSSQALLFLMRRLAVRALEGGKGSLMVFVGLQGSAQSGLASRMAEERAADIETLENFTLQETEEYLRRFTGLDVIPKEWCEGIWKTTSGNPLFLEEVLKSFIDAGTLFDRTGLRINEKVPIPPSVRTIAQQRLKELVGTPLEVVRILAAGEREWGAGELAQLVDQPLPDVAQALVDLQGLSLAQTEGESWGLKGNVLAGVINESSGVGALSTLHARIASYLESTGKGKLEELALHFWAARDLRQGPTYLVSAARIAEGRFQYRRAIDFYEKSLDVMGEAHPDWQPTERRLSRLAALIGDYDKAQGLFSRLARDTGNLGAYGLRGLGWLEIKKGDHRKAQKYYEEGLARLKVLHDSYAVVLLNDLGSIHLMRGELDKAIAIYEESARSLDTLSNWEPVYLYGNQLGLALAKGGRFDEALKWQEMKLAKARATEDSHSEIVSLSELAYIHLQAGRTDEAIRCYEESLEASEKIGYLHNVVKVLNNLISIHQRRALYQKALVYLEKSLGYASRIGTLGDVGQSFLTGAALYTAIGVHLRAATYLDKAEEIFRRLANEAMLGWTMLTRGYYFENQDQTAEATSFFSEAYAYAERNKLDDLAGFASLGIALMALAERDFEQASRYLKKARNAALRGGGELCLRVDLLTLKLEVEGEGRLKAEGKKIRGRLESTPPAELSLEDQIELWQALGNASLAEGDVDKGLGYLKKAKVIVEEILKSLDEEYRQPFLKQRRIRDIYQDLKAAETHARLVKT